MRIIKTRQDIDILRSAKTYPEEFLAYLDDHVSYLLGLQMEKNPEKNVRIEEHKLLVLEPGDNILSLPDIGIESDCGLVGMPIRSVNEGQLGSVSIYQITVDVPGDKFKVSMLSEVGALDPFAESFLKQYRSGC